MKPTVLGTEGQRRAWLKIALVEQHHKPKRTAAYYLVRMASVLISHRSLEKYANSHI